MSLPLRFFATRGVAVPFLVLILLTPLSAKAEDIPALHLQYSVVPGGYDNAVRVASTNDMMYPWAF